MTRYDSESLLLAFEQAPSRVVSLVPSMTETFFDLGLGDKLVGVSDFCRPPEQAAARLSKVGGTKSPDLALIKVLRPDLVLANQEETSKETVEALEAAGLNVWLSFPRNTQDALDILWTLVKLYGLTDKGPSIETLARTLDWTEKATTARLAIPTFVPIWLGETGDDQPYFMTFNGQTYASDVLAKCGGLNVFVGRKRRYPLAADLGEVPEQDPGERDTRYPRVSIEEVRSAQPDIILLPNEPFGFEQSHAAQVEQWLADTPAVQAGRVHLVDGSLLTWHGTRLARALSELPPFLQL